MGHRDDELITIKEAAPYFGRAVTESLLRSWIKKGYGPKPIKIGARCFFTPSQISAWKKLEQEKALSKAVNSAIRKRSPGIQSLLVGEISDVLFPKVHWRGEKRGLQVVKGTQPTQGDHQTQSTFSPTTKGNR
jgi:hypothetical protein